MLPSTSSFGGCTRREMVGRNLMNLCFIYEMFTLNVCAEMVMGLISFSDGKLHLGEGLRDIKETIGSERSVRCDGSGCSTVCV